MVLQLNHLFKKHNELAAFITSQNSSIEEFFANSFTQNQEPNENQQNMQNLIVILDLFGLEIIDFDIGILKIVHAVRFCEYPRDLLFQALHSLSCRLKVCHLDSFSDAVSSIIYQAQQIVSNSHVEQQSSTQSKTNPAKERYLQGKKLFEELQEIEADKENQIHKSFKKQQLQEVFYFEEIFEEDKQEHEHQQENINPADQTIQSNDQEMDLFSTPQFCQFNQSEMLAPNKDSIPLAENSWTFNRSSSYQSEGMYIGNTQGQVLNQAIYSSRKILQEINIPQQSQGQLLEKINFRVQRNKRIASSDKMTEEIISANNKSAQSGTSPIPSSHQQTQSDQQQFQQVYQAPQLIPGKPIQQLNSSQNQKYQSKLQGLKEDLKKLKNIACKLDPVVIRKPNSSIESQIEDFILHQHQSQFSQQAEKQQLTNEIATNTLAIPISQMQDQQVVEMLVESTSSEKIQHQLDFSNFPQTHEDISGLERHELPVNTEKQDSLNEETALNVELKFIQGQSLNVQEQKQHNSNETNQIILEQVQDDQDFQSKNSSNESEYNQNSDLQQQEQYQQQYPQELFNHQEASQLQQVPLAQQNLSLNGNNDLGLFVIEIERRQENSEISEYDRETALKCYQDSRSKSAGSVLTDIQGNHGQANHLHPQDIIINNAYVNDEGSQLEVFGDQMTLPKENRILLQDKDDTIDKHRLNIRNRTDQTHNIQVNPFMIPQNLIVNDSENNYQQLGQGQIEEANKILEEQRRRNRQRRVERNNREYKLEEYYRYIQELRFYHDEQLQSQGLLPREIELDWNVSQNRNIEIGGQDDIAERRANIGINSSIYSNNSNHSIKQRSSQQENKQNSRRQQESARNIGISRWYNKYSAFFRNNRKIIFLRGFLSETLKKYILKGFQALSTERKSMVIIASITVGMTIIL